MHCRSVSRASKYTTNTTRDGRLSKRGSPAGEMTSFDDTGGAACIDQGEEAGNHAVVGDGTAAGSTVGWGWVVQ